MSSLTDRNAARAARSLIREAIRQFDNGESGLEAEAVAAAQAGHAAFWSKARYSHTAARLFLSAANRDGLRAAIAQVAPTDNRNATLSALVATLLPLNNLAAAQLDWAKSEADWLDAPGAGRAA